jgi:hypothetical protein
MLGGLLIFYQQAMLHRRHWEDARGYNIEKPLWVLLGTSVSRKRPDEKDTTRTAEEERTDVGEVVAFLRRFLEKPDWAQDHIGKAISGKSGFAEMESGIDLFEKHIKHISDEDAAILYKGICRDLFHGQGGLEIVEIKRSGEIGLRVTAASHKELPYFGLINIGDVADFRKYLQEKHKIDVRQDVINDSLFDRISQADSPINMLIGAKKFIEGWSSWRVSSMGLLRIGKGEGSQVIQLFGRGVRLKGIDKSLKRSHSLTGSPDWLESLETLYITGWNADYLQTFRKLLEREDLAKELAPLKVVQQKLPFWTYVPQVPKGFDCSGETWLLNTEGPYIPLDLRPQVESLAPGETGAREGTALAGETTTVIFDKDLYLGIVDIDRLHAEVKEYKIARGYRNVFISRDSLHGVLTSRCELRMLKEEAQDPERVQRAASRALKTYLDKFVRMRERQTESLNAEPRHLISESQVVQEYRITVHVEGVGENLLKDIEKILKTVKKKQKELLKDAGDPLPRVYWDRHLFNPLLVEGNKEWMEHVSINPPPLMLSERKLAEDLRAFWKENCNKPEYRDIEICLLRNLPKTGVGMFTRSGFYPDFIFWIRNKKTKAVRVVFLDPHGLHHEGVIDNDRFAAIEKLRELGKNKQFKKKDVTLNGFILAPSDTSPDKIPGAKDKTWDEMEKEYPLLRQGGSYITRLFSTL